MTPTTARVREQDGRGPHVAGTPQSASPLDGFNDPHQVTVEPPSGGDSRAHTRSVAPRVAPAPVRALVRALALVTVIVGLHAAASHPIPAVLLAAALLAITALTARR